MTDSQFWTKVVIRLGDRTTQLQATYFSSSNIDAAAYHHGDLYIRFHHGGTYKYGKVPHAVFVAMVESESAGQYFHKHIKKTYEFTKLDADPFMTAPITHAA